MYRIFVKPAGGLDVFRIPKTDIFVDPLLVNVYMRNGKVHYYVNTPIQADWEPLQHTDIRGRRLKYHGCTLIRRPRYSSPTLVCCSLNDYELIDAEIIYRYDNDDDAKVIAFVREFKRIKKEEPPCRCKEGEDCVCY